MNANSDRTAIVTERLILRPWKETDFEPFARLNADPKVMEYFPSLLSTQESDRLAERFQAQIDKEGWGPWAVSLLETSAFIGFIGLLPVTFSLPFTPAVEMPPQSLASVSLPIPIMWFSS